MSWFFFFPHLFYPFYEGKKSVAGWKKNVGPISNKNWWDPLHLFLHLFSPVLRSTRAHKADRHQALESLDLKTGNSPLGTHSRWRKMTQDDARSVVLIGADLIVVDPQPMHCVSIHFVTICDCVIPLVSPVYRCVLILPSFFCRCLGLSLPPLSILCRGTRFHDPSEWNRSLLYMLVVLVV